MIIEGSIAKFSINEIGKTSGETFMGEFEVKCFLSPLEIIKADKLYRELLGETNPHLSSTDVQNICFALSQLKFRVLKAPAGWKHPEIDGGHLDANIVVSVLNKAMDAEIEYRKRNKQKMKTLQKKLTEEIRSGKFEEEKEITTHEEGENL